MTIMRPNNIAVLLFAVAAIAAAPVRAQDPTLFTTLTPAIDEAGTNEEWAWGMRGDAFFIQNTNGRDTAYRYFWAWDEAPAFGQRTITVSFDIAKGNEVSAAGFVYNFDPDTEHYYMITVGMDGYASIIRVDDDFTEVANTNTDAVHAGVNEVAIVENGNVAEFQVNGQTVLTYKSGQRPDGGVGIVAWGIGTYSFHSFVEAAY